MAKKSVANLQKDSGNRVKLIRPVKNKRTGRYSFREEMVTREQSDEYVKQQQ
jgi:hypothetical protein